MQTLSYWQSIKEPGTIKLQSSKCVIGREKKKAFLGFCKGTYVTLFKTDPVRKCTDLKSADVSVVITLVL